MQVEMIWYDTNDSIYVMMIIIFIIRMFVAFIYHLHTFHINEIDRKLLP